MLTLYKCIFCKIIFHLGFFYPAFRHSMQSLPFFVIIHPTSYGRICWAVESTQHSVLFPVLIKSQEEDNKFFFSSLLMNKWITMVSIKVFLFLLFSGERKLSEHKSEELLRTEGSTGFFSILLRPVRRMKHEAMRNIENECWAMDKKPSEESSRLVMQTSDDFFCGNAFFAWMCLASFCANSNPASP